MVRALIGNRRVKLHAVSQAIKSKTAGNAIVLLDPGQGVAERPTRRGASSNTATKQSGRIVSQ